MLNKFHKTIVISLFVLFLSSQFTGCVEEEETTVDPILKINNIPPKAEVKCPSQAYFGDLIEFDASDSIDSDGEIISFDWDFRDGVKKSGVIVDHVFNFDNEYNIQYPIVYTISLLVTDNDGSAIIKNQEIKLFPKNYILFLSKNSFSSQIPIDEIEELKIKKDGLFSNSINEINYILKEAIYIPKCEWNLTLYIEKPVFSNIKEIKLILFDESGSEISNTEIKLDSLIQFWTEKQILLKNSISKEYYFKSAKLIFKGNSYNKNIKIFYGNEKPSSLSFNFKGIDW